MGEDESSDAGASPQLSLATGRAIAALDSVLAMHDRGHADAREQSFTCRTATLGAYHRPHAMGRPQGSGCIAATLPSDDRNHACASRRLSQPIIAVLPRIRSSRPLQEEQRS